MAYLVDSDILSDVSRRRPAAIQFVDALPQAWAISQFSVLEIIVGARDNRDLAKMETFLSGSQSFR